MIIKSETRNSLKTLKSRNRKLVLTCMRGTGSVSVNELSQATGLSKMTIHKIIDHYLETGMVTLTGKGESTEEGGKKPNLFAFNPDCRFIFAVRISGGAVSTCITNLRGERLADRKRTSLESLNFSSMISLIRDDFDMLVRRHRLDPHKCLSVVVGCNGIVDVENGVCLAFYELPEWGINLPIGQSLSQIFPGEVPIYVNSWWRQLAYGEIIASEGEERQRFFLMGNLGEQIAGGMVVDGKVVSGATGFAGEIGHMVVNSLSSDTCVCGGTGCLQVLAAPGRVVKRIAGLKDQYPDSQIFTSGNGSGITLQSIGQAADQGDFLACSQMDEVASYFAVAINNIVQICDPGMVVLFGDYTQAGEYFLDSLRQKVDSLTMHGIDKRTRIESTELDVDWALAGAASLVADKLFDMDS